MVLDIITDMIAKFNKKIKINKTNRVCDMQDMAFLDNSKVKL